jgi:hypothetical protein
LGGVLNKYVYLIIHLSSIIIILKVSCWLTSTSSIVLEGKMLMMWKQNLL